MSVDVIAGTVVVLDRVDLATEHGPFTAHRLHDLATGAPVLVITRGDPTTPAPLLARVHSSCVTSEVFLAGDCDCADQLSAALAQIAAAGRGAIFYLIQEGRGAGFVAKARDRMLVQESIQRLTTFDAYAAMGIASDTRRYEVVGHACRALGITAPLRLLTNNPEKCHELAQAGLTIAGTAPLAPVATPLNLHYLDAKARAGHTIDDPTRSVAEADLPESVTALVPHPVPGAPEWIVLAEYLLPLRLAPTAWFRLRVFLHRETRAERVILGHGLGTGASTAPLVRVQHDHLLERLPLADRPRRWHAAARAIVAHGAGLVLFVPPDTAFDAGSAALLAAELGARQGHPLVDAIDDPALAGLAAAGITGDPVLVPPA